MFWLNWFEGEAGGPRPNLQGNRLQQAQSPPSPTFLYAPLQSNSPDPVVDAQETDCAADCFFSTPSSLSPKGKIGNYNI